MDVTARAGAPRTRERPDVQRGRILDAAIEVFSRSGVPDASIGDIAATAGISRTLLYHYFPGKAEIIEALQIEAIAEIQELVQTMRARGGSGTDQISFLVSQYHDALTARPAIVNLIACGPAPARGHASAKVQRRLRKLRQTLTEWMETLPGARTDIEPLSLLLIGLGTLSSWFSPAPLADALGARPGTTGRAFQTHKTAVTAVLISALLANSSPDDQDA
jgi:AcrR family transcriptional regulator